MSKERLREIAGSAPAILPSLLQCDFGYLADEVQRLEEAGVVALHLDVMDGVFVPNFTYGMTIVSAIKKVTNLVVDVHLMMVNPEKYLEAFRDAGSDILTVHGEACDDARPVLDSIRDLGMASGIAINPPTPVSSIAAALPHADLALVMSVNAGFGGQSFNASVLEKLGEIRGLDGGEDIVLEMDGGINRETISECYKAGTQLFVAGSAIFNHQDYRIAMESMMEEVQ